MTLEELKKEAVEEFLENWSRSFENLVGSSDDAVWTGSVLKKFEKVIRKNVKEFIEVTVEKSFKNGAKETIEVISEDQVWEETEKFYKKKLLK